MQRANLVGGFPPGIRAVFLFLSFFGAMGPWASAQNHGEAWSVREQKDGMTGKGSFFGLLQTKVDSNGRTGTAQVKANCEPSMLEFEITYVADFKPSPGLRRIQGNPSLTGVALGGAVYGQVSTPRPVVSMRASIDEHLDTLQVPTAEINSVTFRFIGTRAGYDAKIRNARSTPFARMQAQSEKIWAVDAVLSARLIKFELPLANGDTPILEIRPQDATFRRFVDRCNADRSLEPRTPGYQREDKRFTGTADEFAAAFPDLLRRAAAEARLDAQKYAKAAEIVVNGVKTCAQITPAMGLSVQGKGPRGLDGADQLEGGKYVHCFVGEKGGFLLSTAGDKQAPAGERGMTVLIQPPSGMVGGWTKGTSFGVDVFFTGANTANPYLMTAPDVEMIVRARVDRAK